MRARRSSLRSLRERINGGVVAGGRRPHNARVQSALGAISNLCPQNVMGLRNRRFLGLSQGARARFEAATTSEVAMSPRMRKIGALAGAAAVLSFGAYAIGSQAGDGVAQSRSGSAQGLVAYGGP